MGDTPETSGAIDRQGRKETVKSEKHVDCTFFSFGSCRHPIAPVPGLFSWRPWARCVLLTDDARIGCVIRERHPAPDPPPRDPNGIRPLPAELILERHQPMAMILAGLSRECPICHRQKLIAERYAVDPDLPDDRRPGTITIRCTACGYAREGTA